MNAPSTSRTANILRALGIKKLYWIDDKFYEEVEANRDALAIATSNAIADAISSGVSITLLAPALADLAKAGLDHEQIVELAKQHIENAALTSTQLMDILKGLNALPDDADDLNDAQFSKFEELLKTGPVELIKLSFGKWQQNKAELVSNQEALYLIDYENKREDNGITGDVILEHLAGLDDASPFSIVFTHVCEPDGEQEKATDFHAHLNKSGPKPYRQFSVMSKKRLRDQEQLDDLDNVFAPPLKRLAIGHTYRQVATTCLEGYQKGMSEALDKLDSMPVADMYRAIFERTWEEGASEIDVVCRILNGAQRKAMFDEIVAATKKAGGNFFPALTALRNVSDIAFASETPTIDPYIAALHEVEVFDSEIINNMHLPLACGDIFQKSIDGQFTGPQYILLAPPCDLMVRTDSANRNALEGIFVPLKKSTLETTSTPDEEAESLDKKGTRHKRWEITKQNGSTLFADFHEPFTVNLSVLDYCVWNSTGEVKFNRNNPPRESRMFLEGWLKRLRAVIQKCQHSFPPEYRALCFVGGPNDFRERTDPPNGDLVFPLKRTGRLRSPYAEAVLNEYLAALGRPAFDHPLVG